MRTTILSVMLIVLTGAADTLAQGSSSVSKNSGNSGGTVQAPIGHRQPRPSDLSNQKTVSDASAPTKEDLALDRKIKSICRGC
jgi:hypothetical protein